MKHAEWNDRLVLERDSVESGPLTVKITKRGEIYLYTKGEHEVLMTREDMEYILEKWNEFVK
jgi:hypothetical protein